MPRHCSIEPEIRYLHVGYLSSRGIEIIIGAFISYGIEVTRNHEVVMQARKIIQKHQLQKQKR